MGEYEREQKRLEAMWTDILSDEESDISEFGDVYLSDEYAPSRDSLSANSDSDSDVVVPRKRSKFDLTATDDEASTNAIEDSNNEEDIEIGLDSLTWTPVDGSSLKQFTFTVGIKPDIYEAYINQSPYDVFKLFLTDNIVTYMVQEKNCYTEQCLSKEGLKPRSGIKKWIPTNNIEMERFLSMLLFELLLKMWHFSDNDDMSLESDRLRKFTPLINKLIERFQEVSRPGLKVCIDETMVPFHGRLRFRQFIKNKRHKFGIKLYKLSTEGGYTYNVKVYCSSDTAEEGQASSNVVFSLMNNLLDSGRQLFTDNYYTSVCLGIELLKRNTHLIGTLRSNRKYNPKEVTKKS
ncbi:hypothetical protein NQ314_014582 [Rhamnusium bicolor]|uniref:PiggyBac transposable element-derived protein domain-containing protein n=1 Tax=Rhamnusium bicolor TaxID=1586634 RepID=A0AAV8X1L9_9CUCU|nr:hypothetical protein NQ314_014582 [Rhamnusium bicolor]